MIAIVITSYQRAHVVRRALDSALAFTEGLPGAEILVVDDASTDGTPAMLEEAYGAEIAAGRLRLIVHPENRGVTGAKNTGGLAATAPWVTFLDSDDLLLAEHRDAALGVLAGVAPGVPAVFFRCTDQDGRPVGEALEASRTLSLADLLGTGTRGEALPVLRTPAFRQFPYVAALRGYEGLSYIRMARSLGPLYLSTLRLRVYDTSGDDRLSQPRTLLWRRCRLARGHLMVFRDTLGHVSPRLSARVLAKAGHSAALCAVSKLRRG